MSGTFSSDPSANALGVRLFDAAFYLSNNADVLSAVSRGETTAQQHFAQFGKFEGRAPTSFFDAQAYIAANPDVANYLGSRPGFSAFDHFITFGVVENRGTGAFLGNFDAEAYLASNPDVADAVDSGVFRSAFEHFILFGASEGRQGLTTEGQALNGTNPGETFPLTIGVDNIVGTAGDDIINALPLSESGANASTFTAFDNIDGGAGNDVLNIYAAENTGLLAPDYNTAFPANASVRNVEVVNVNWITGASTNGSLTDVSNYVGVKQLWQAGSAANVTNATGDVTIGFRNVSNLSDSITVATGENTANIALENSVGTLTTSGATTVSVSGEKAAGAFTLNVGTTGTATGVTVSTAVATTITASLAAVTALDASASTGDVTYAATNDVSLKTGSGDDTVTGAFIANAVVDLGAGDDTLSSTFAANASVNLGAGDDSLTGPAFLAATGTYDGGEGSDTVASNLINAGNGAKFLNFEVLGLNSNGGPTLDLNLITGSDIESLELISGGTFQNVQLDQSLSIVGNGGITTELNFTGATGAADAYSITFDGTGTTTGPAASVAAGVVNLVGAENVLIDSGSASGSTANSITLGGSTVETVTISGDQALALTFAGATGGVTSIDGSGATGALSINLTGLTGASAGFTATGGSAADVITAGAFEATLTGGAGADAFNVMGATYTSVPDGIITTITDFSAGDVIDFANAADSGTSVALGAAADISTATTFDEALNLAASDADAVAWFQYAGNTYLVNDVAAGGGITAADHVVQLVGVVDLSTSLYNAAGGSLTFA